MPKSVAQTFVVKDTQKNYRVTLCRTVVAIVFVPVIIVVLLPLPWCTIILIVINVVFVYGFPNDAILILQRLLRIIEQLIRKDSEGEVVAFTCKGYYAV